MAFDSINAAEIKAGEPTKQELFGKVKDNEDDLDTRVTNLEAIAFASLVPLSFPVFGDYSEVGAREALGVTRISGNATINAGRLLIYGAGGSGTTEIDFKYKRGVGAWTSVFSTKPSVAFGAGDYGLSTNGILDTTELNAGDLIRMDIISSQTSDPDGFTGLLELEPR